MAIEFSKAMKLASLYNGIFFVSNDKEFCLKIPIEKGFENDFNDILDDDTGLYCFPGKCKNEGKL